MANLRILREKKVIPLHMLNRAKKKFVLDSIGANNVVDIRFWINDAA